MATKLKWSQGNVKLPSRIIHLSLPSGYSCPMALKCLAKADKHTGKITDGSEQEYRCYAAMQEARHTALRKSRWHNYQTLKNLNLTGIYNTLKSTLLPIHEDFSHNYHLPPIIRAHVGGDFFKEDYFLAWLKLAETLEPTWFYSYTKRTDLWIKHIEKIPPNFELNASRGGKRDDLIDKHNLKCAEVVFNKNQAKKKGLLIDHDDSLAYTRGPSFAQLIHGCQKAGSKASKAIQLLKKEGWTGYNKDSKGV